MKKKSHIIALAITMIVGIGITSYAATTPNSPSRNNVTMESCKGKDGTNTTHLRGHDILTNLLKSKGITEEEISSALDSGKSLYNLLNDKGVTDVEIKEYMLTERIKNIDDAVAKGVITKAQGEEAKTRIKEHSANCENPGHENGKMKGSGNRSKMKNNSKN